jgi:peptide chain release factor 2
MSAPDFWEDKDRAQQTVAELSICKNLLEPFFALEGNVEDFEVLLELIDEEDGSAEMLAEGNETVETLFGELERLEIVSFLSGEFDSSNAYITLKPGSGGTESCDWAAMLFRMYSRWVERRGFVGDIMELQSGEVAGIKSATLYVKGDFAYGYLAAERGVHRLVRLSPFDSSTRRHTSFAALDVVPEIPDDVEVEIDEKDLRVDTYRSSGAGGQHVNVTDSAVRLTHLPTGIACACQNERSQHQNKATALRMLRSKLYELQLAERQAAQDAEIGPREDNAFGSQIRSYVLHPYKMVKDLRTNEETSDTNGVLDGDLDAFIEAYLRKSGK